MNENEALRLAKLALESSEQTTGNFPGGLIVTVSPNGDGQSASIETNFGISEDTDGAYNLVETLKSVLSQCDGGNLHNFMEKYKYHEDDVYHLLACYED